MGSVRPRRLPADPENAAAYDELYAEYLTLHDYFGRGGNDVMHRLKARRRAVAKGAGRDRLPRPTSTVAQAATVADLHTELTRNGLGWTAGNVLRPRARPRPHGDQAVGGLLTS